MMKIVADVFWTECNSLVNETVSDVLVMEPEAWRRMGVCKPDLWSVLVITEG